MARVVGSVMESETGHSCPLKHLELGSACTENLQLLAFGNGSRHSGRPKILHQSGVSGGSDSRALRDGQGQAVPLPSRLISAPGGAVGDAADRLLHASQPKLELKRDTGVPTQVGACLRQTKLSATRAAHSSETDTTGGQRFAQDACRAAGGELSLIRGCKGMQSVTETCSRVCGSAGRLCPGWSGSGCD